MKNIIYCFSGTGNSLALARDIAEKLGDTEVVLIADAINGGRTAPSYQRIGFAFPVYYAGGLPPIIERFIAKLDFTQAKYVFAVITAGAVHGGAFDRLAGLIQERGGHLDAGFPVRMPGNYIAMYGAWPAPLQGIMLKRAMKKTVQITRDIRGERSNWTGEKQTKKTKSLTERISGYERFALDYQVTDKCAACGLCSKMCPMNNIAIVDGRACHGALCERCLACIQWCPARAIEYKEVTQKRQRYTNPNIKAADLFRKQGKIEGGR